jgi:hypothetical protein
VTSIIVRNSGTSKVTDVVFRLSLIDAKLDDYALEDRAGIVSKSELADGKLVVFVPAMLPSEQFSLAFMSTTANPIAASEPTVHLRASELLGYEKEPDSKTPRELALLSSLLAGISVAAMGLGFSTRAGPFGTLLRRFTDKHERLLFVGLASQLSELRSLVTEGEPTYRECGTALLAASIGAPDGVKQRIALSLCALLLIERIHPESRRSIEDAISSMRMPEGAHPSFVELRQQAKQIRSTEDYRRAVIALLS